MPLFLSRTLLVALPVSLSLCTLPLCAPVFAEIVRDPAPPAALPDTGHGAPLASVAYAPDGQVLWSLDQTGALLLRSRDAKRTLFRGAITPGQSDLRVLKNGSFLTAQSAGAVVLYPKPQENQALASTRLFAGEELAAQTLGNPGPLFRLQLGDWALSPDEKRLAIVTLETAREETNSPPGKAGPVSARVRVWNVETGQIESELPLLAAPVAQRGERRSAPARFFPRVAWGDAQTLVVASDVATQSFDATSGAPKGSWNPPATGAPVVNEAAEAAEQRRRLELLPPGVRERAIAAFERRQANGTAPDAPSFGQLAGLSRDGQWLIAATRAGLQLWNTRENTGRILEGSARTGTMDFAFSPDGNFVAGRSGSAVRLWKTDGSALGFSLGTSELADLAFAPDTKEFAVANDAGQALSWPTNAPLSKVAAVTFPGYFNGWNAIRVAGNTVLVATGKEAATLDANGQPRWFKFLPIEAPVALPPATHFSLHSIALAPDGKSWAETAAIESYSTTMGTSGIPRSEVRVRDVASGQILWRKPDFNPYRWVEAMAYLPDGTLLTGKEGGGISSRPLDESLTGLNAFNGQSGASVDLNIEWGSGRRGTGYPGSVHAIAVAPNGETALFGGNNESIIADLKTRQRIGFVDMNADEWIGTPAIAPGGDFMAGQRYSAIGLWDLRNEDKNYGNRMAVKLDAGSGARANDFSYAPDGKLAVALADGRVLVWAPNPAKDAKPQWETEPGRAARTLSWSSDGKTLLVGDARGDLKIRDGATGELQNTLRLMAPAEGETPNWIRWNRAGVIETN